MGGGVSSLPAYIDKETFRQLSGGAINDAIFDANCENGVLSRERLMELAQMRDTYFSHDFGNDCEGRDIMSRVEMIDRALRGRGLLTWWKDKFGNNANSAQMISNGIDKSRTFLCFITEGYVSRVVRNDPADQISIEFNYVLRRKHPQHIIPVVLEHKMLDKSLWKGSLAMALAPLEYIDLSSDNNFDALIDILYQRIAKISKAGENLFAPPQAQSNSVLSQTDKPREELQFFQWMARSTQIEDSRRIIYCSSLVKAGVSNVFILAKTMKANPTFLTSIGIAEHDADEIALAVRDLGLGYVPVRDFDHASTMESVVYAMKKAANAQEDPTLAEGALHCVVRVASSHPIMPKILEEAAICEAILKLMNRNLGHAPSMRNGCLAIHTMAVNNPEICEKFGSIAACDVLPRTMRSHRENPEVVFECAQAIATLAGNMDNRKLFSNTGACDVVVQAMMKCMQYPDVVERCCYAANQLSIQWLENIGRLGMAGACEAVSLALNQHPSHQKLNVQVFALLNLISTEPSNRTALGKLEGTSAIIKALSLQLDSPEIIIPGCLTIYNVISGNAFNRQQFGLAGACEVTSEILRRYHHDAHVVEACCRAMFSLSSGNLEHKQRYAPIRDVLQHVLHNPNLPDSAKKEAYEASRFIF